MLCLPVIISLGPAFKGVQWCFYNGILGLGAVFTVSHSIQALTLLSLGAQGRGLTEVADGNSQSTRLPNDGHMHKPKV